MASYVFDACGLLFFLTLFLFSFIAFVTCNEASMIHGIQTFSREVPGHGILGYTKQQLGLKKVIEWLEKNNRWWAKGTRVNRGERRDDDRPMAWFERSTQAKLCEREMRVVCVSAVIDEK